MWTVARILLVLGFTIPLALAGWIFTMPPRPGNIGPGDGFGIVLVLPVVLATSALAFVGSFVFTAITVHRATAPGKLSSWLLLATSLLGALVTAGALLAFVGAMQG